MYLLSWDYEVQSNFAIHHSSPFIGFPHNLKGYSHFLFPLAITSKSFMYRLYLPPLSQLNNMHVFILYCSLVVLDLNITITQPKL